MIAFDDWEQVRREVERMQRDYDRAEGALAQLTARMKEVLGVATLKEAKLKLKELEDEERQAAAKWEKALAAYRKAVQGKLPAG